MKKKKIPIGKELLQSVLDLIKSDNTASKTTIADCLNISRMTVHRAISQLKQDKTIKAKAERIGIVEQYEILKKD